MLTPIHGGFISYNYSYIAFDMCGLASIGPFYILTTYLVFADDESQAIAVTVAATHVTHIDLESI